MKFLLVHATPEKDNSLEYAETTRVGAASPSGSATNAATYTPESGIASTSFMARATIEQADGILAAAQRFYILTPGILVHAGFFDTQGDAQTQDKEGPRRK